jgi:hypothetical protein
VWLACWPVHVAAADESPVIDLPPAVGTFVIVRTSDGRTRRGFVDTWSDSGALRLRNEAPGVLLRATVPWEMIESVRTAEADAEFVTPPLVPLWRGPASPPFDWGPGPMRSPGTVSPREGASPAPWSPWSPIAPLAPVSGMLPGAILPYPSVGVLPSAPVPPRLSLERAPGVAVPPAAARSVRTLQAEAQSISWDADAEVDGLRLLLQPIARDGRLAGVTGHVTVELRVRRFDRIRNDDAVELVESWSREVRPTDFGPDGFILDLPYRRRDFRDDPRYIPVGTVSVRLRVPGQGAFDALVDEVLLQGRPSLGNPRR